MERSIISKDKVSLLFKSDCLHGTFVNTKLIVDSNNVQQIVLSEDYTKGYYLSNEIDTVEFKKLICSWSAYTSSDCTIELLVRVETINGWSKFLSYCPHGIGFGLLNKGIDDKDDIASIIDDEIIINNDYANKVQYKVIFRRTSKITKSPCLSLVSIMIITDKYEVLKPSLNDTMSSVLYDVPFLYQREVPMIGSSICSPTSITMLLKFFGYSFQTFDKYEHRYYALKCKDYGHNIFGNWVYSTSLASTFGAISYVEYMYSVDDLLYYLSNYGPLAICVKGLMKSNYKTYDTKGHLLVLVGYKIEDNNIIFISNDPNVDHKNIEYSYDNIKEVWRNVAYILSNHFH